MFVSAFFPCVIDHKFKALHQTSQSFRLHFTSLITYLNYMNYRMASKLIYRLKLALLIVQIDKMKYSYIMSKYFN